MKLLMLSGDRSMLAGKQGAFWYTLEEFSKHWERIDVITPKVPSAKGEVPSFFGNVFFHPAPRGLWNQQRWIREKGRELIAIHGHDVMTVHDYPPFYNGQGAIELARRMNIPFALEIHHIVGFPRPASFSERIGKVLTRWILPDEARHASAVRVVNKTVAAQVRRWGIAPSKVTVVPSFYLDRDVLLHSSDTRKTYDLCFAGRLVENKGLEQVIRAVALLPKTSLLIIGDGPERAYNEHLVKELGIDHQVTFAGWQATQEEVYRAMASAKIFLMNSLSEGGPRVALEAMAMGLPVISTRVGVMNDVLEDGRNGFFTTGEHEDIAEKIGRLLSDDQLRMRMGQNAQAILQRFERKDLIAKYAHFLQSLARP